MLRIRRSKKNLGKGNVKENRRNRTRKQNGGKKIYLNVDALTENEIEMMFCNSLTIDRLPTQEKPIFVYKWGPPGSGKSSKKVLDSIRNLGYPLDSYLNIDTDLIYESLLPFRLESSLMKVKELRLKANYSIRDFASVKVFLTQFSSGTSPYQKYFSPSFVANVRSFLEGWTTGQPLQEYQIGELKQLLAKITDNTTSALFRYYQNDKKNTRGLSIYDKITNVLKKGFANNKSIVYETIGSGYMQTSDIMTTIRDPQFNTSRRTRDRTGLIDIYKNPKEQLLGKIVYNEGVPVGIDERSLTDESIPLHYRIIVVYPIIPKKTIVQRAYLRALQSFTDKTAFELPSVSDDKAAYIEIYQDFLEEMLRLLNPADPRIREHIDQLIQEENTDYKESYTDYIRSLRDMSRDPAITQIYPPFFRGIAFERIETMIDQAFQYSIDFFLKQYLMIGRIERIVYVSTLE
jgi:hypothetical protein